MILSKWFLPSRLETRTKESNIYASVRVIKLIREMKVKDAQRKWQHRPTQCERFEYEHICQDPKDGELCLSRVKSGETLMEARSAANVQIARQTWVQGRKTNRTIQQLVPPEVSLRIAGTKTQFYQVKRMIRGNGALQPCPILKL